MTVTKINGVMIVGYDGEYHYFTGGENRVSKSLAECAVVINFTGRQ